MDNDVRELCEANMDLFDAIVGLLDVLNEFIFGIKSIR
jgi:hypothetical protein